MHGRGGCNYWDCAPFRTDGVCEWQADAAKREAAELAECTFRPEAAPLALAAPGPGDCQQPVVVHGLNRFLERKVGLSTDPAP